MAAFALYHQSEVILTETIWLTKPKIFTGTIGLYKNKSLLTLAINNYKLNWRM